METRKNRRKIKSRTAKKQKLEEVSKKTERNKNPSKKSPLLLKLNILDVFKNIKNLHIRIFYP